MLALLQQNSAAAVNSIGLLCDIAGAWLVAIEVVKQYRGPEFKNTSVGWGGTGKPPEKTVEYRRWELFRHRTMFVGLLLLTVGFLLQIASNWIK